MAYGDEGVTVFVSVRMGCNVVGGSSAFSETMEKNVTIKMKKTDILMLYHIQFYNVVFTAE